MSFISIVPRDEGFLSDMSNAVRLNTIMSNGVNTTPDIKINLTELSKGYNHFYNTSGDGISFKIRVIIDKDEKVKDKALTEWLDEHIRKMTPFYINTEAIDVKQYMNKPFLIIKNDSRVQTGHNKTEWDLEFKTYNPVNVYRYKNDNKTILDALNKAKQNKKGNKKNNGKITAKQASAIHKKFHKCDYKAMKYSKSKKTHKCIKYLQQVLYLNKCIKKKHITGRYDKNTVTAVKQFQKNHNLKLKAKNVWIKQSNKFKGKKTNKKSLKKLLKENGKVDIETWKALDKS